MFERGQSAWSRLRGRVGRCGIYGAMGLQIKDIGFFFLVNQKAMEALGQRITSDGLSFKRLILLHCRANCRRLGQKQGELVGSCID